MPNKLTFSKQYKERLLLDEEETRRIKELYSNVSKSIQDHIKSISGKNTNTAYLRSLFLNDLQNSLNQELSNVHNNIYNNIIRDARQITLAVLEENVNWANQFSLRFNANMASVQSDIVASVINGRLYDKLPDGSNWTLSKAIWNTNSEIQSTIESIIAEGIVRNEGAVDIARNLEYFVNPERRINFDLSRIYPSASGVVDYNALRLARTSVSHAYQQSIIRSVEKNPFIEGLRWYTSHDHRVCQICIEREETDHHGMGIGIYPKDEVPLDHPNGRCTLIPETLPLSDVADHIANWVNGIGDQYSEGIEAYVNSF